MCLLFFIQLASIGLEQFLQTGDEFASGLEAVVDGALCACEVLQQRG